MIFLSDFPGNSSKFEEPSVLYLHIPLDLIIGGRVKEDVNKDQVREFFHKAIVIDVMIKCGKVNFGIAVLIEVYVLCKGVLIALVTFLDGIEHFIILGFSVLMLNICIKPIARDVAGKHLTPYSFIARAPIRSAELANLQIRKGE